MKFRYFESDVEEVYFVKFLGSLGYEYMLDFFKMVEKLKYWLGVYIVDLIVGDDVMENFFIWSVVFLDLDLLEGFEEMKVDVFVLKFVFKVEIVYIFC